MPKITLSKYIGLNEDGDEAFEPVEVEAGHVQRAQTLDNGLTRVFQHSGINFDVQETADEVKAALAAVA